jgi:hypothetical protein
MSNIILSTSTTWVTFVSQAEYKGKPKKEVVANFRLKRGDDCLAAHLRKIGTVYMNLVSAQYAKYQIPPWTRNICHIALNSILTNK